LGRTTFSNRTEGKSEKEKERSVIWREGDRNSKREIE